MVLPGPYPATLTVNGRSNTHAVAFVADPDLPVPAAGLAAEFQLQQRMVAGIGATYRAFNHIQELRAALGARTTQANNAPIATAGQALDAALNQIASGPAGLGVPARDPRPPPEHQPFAHGPPPPPSRARAP